MNFTYIIKRDIVNVWSYKIKIRVTSTMFLALCVFVYQNEVQLSDPQH